jgi:signal transduction histidine kinase
MMFSSLRSRLWFTYLLLIAVSLGVVGVSLFFYLAATPNRQAEQKLRFDVAEIVARMEASQVTRIDRIQTLIEREDQVLGVRIQILSPEGTVLADSEQNRAAPLNPIRTPFRIQNEAQLNPVLLVRDTSGVVWVYRLRRQADGNILLAAVQRQSLNLQLVLRDEFTILVLRAGLIALVLSIILGTLMARWIATPLQRIASAARSVTQGEYQTIPPQGPQEVKDLATAFNEMAHRVQTSQQSQRDFVANVSHELKTPLTSIQGFSQAILDGTANTTESLQKAAGIIHDEADRMYRLVLDLLTLARLDAGTANLERGLVDLNVLLQGIVDKLAPQAGLAQVSLETNLVTLPDVVGDGDRLSEVFTNLVDNALKYTPAQGHVLISARQNGDWVEVSVADTGSGLSEEEQSRIFERFYQADRARRGGAGRGVGLGLAIAREIIHAHGGTIQVISVPGKGSEFLTRIPAARRDTKNPIEM